MSPTINYDNPSFTHEAYSHMAERWMVCRHVYGGTDTIRANYETYLWQSPAETGEEWKARADQLEVFPAFKQTVDGLTGIVFRVEPQLGKDVPQIIRDHAENIDGQGTHLVVFLKELFREAMRDGHMGVVVEAPRAPEPTTPRPLTRLEERQAGLRPYWIKVSPSDILSWRVALINGVLVLTQLVLREVSEEADGMFASMYVTRYRKYKIEDDGRVSFRVWTEEQVQSWGDTSYDNPDEVGFLANQKEIPFVVVYAGEKLGPLVTKPGLLDLAYTNIKHMNRLSDMDNGLHAALHPILVFKGRRFNPKDKTQDPNKDQQLIGPNIGIDLPADANADVYYAEHAGNALGAGRESIQDIEKRMAAQGLAMLQNDTRAAETAEAKRIDKDEKTANLSSAARSLQDGAELMLAFHANYLKLPSGGSMLVNRQFEQRPLDSAVITALSNMVANGQLSLETMWEILKGIDLLPEDLDFERELARIAGAGMIPGQGPPLPSPVTKSTSPKSKATGDTGPAPGGA